MCGMVCIAHVGTRNVSVDRLTPSELGDTTTFIQEKKSPPVKIALRLSILYSGLQQNWEGATRATSELSE